jgi:hypothetical protein
MAVGKTASVSMDKLEEIVRVRQGASATTSDVEASWQGGFLYKCSGVGISREKASSAIDVRVRAYRSRQVSPDE